MRQLTFPSDITWQKSMCLTAYLNSSTITSTMQEVSKGWCWAGKLLFYHAARQLFWLKEGSQATCPYNEILNGISFSSTSPGTHGGRMIISGQLPELHLHSGYPSKADYDQQMLVSYSREPFHSWEPAGMCYHCSEQAICLNSTAGPSCPGGDISLGLDLTQIRGMAMIHSQTWELPKTPIPTAQKYQGKSWASKIPHK